MGFSNVGARYPTGLCVEQKCTMVEDNELTSYVGDHRRTYEFQLWTLRNHDEASSLHEGSTQLGHKIGKFKTLTLTAIYTYINNRLLIYITYNNVICAIVEPRC